ncbi:MAG TPA: extracellular solute-binding protein [Candidatus Acidoferrales bacterium]|jgi:arabinogalactan oligomer/maltooligosaccharide transport system substrate-binding protein|nr:extracellular solute-binding protein [Candidatus Acidoferrales bacterium]
MTQFKRLAVLAAGVVFVASACGNGATTAPSTAASTTPSQAATTSPTAAPLTGKLTIWHSYGSSGGGSESAEVQGLNKILDMMKTNNPGLTIEAINVDFNTMYTNFEQESANGGGPDMFIGPNDNLGNEARGGYLVDLTGKIDDTLANTSDVAKNGSMVDGKVYMVPESLKAVAMYYDASKVPTPPATTEDLLNFAKGGGKLGVLTEGYFGWGWYSAFGGSIFDANGKCAATATTGVADALTYVDSLNDQPSVVVDSDYGKINDPFIAGNLDIIFNGNWALGDYRKARPNLGVAPFVTGPGGPGKSMTGVDGWYINAAATPDQQALAIAAAQQMVSAPAQQFMVDTAGHVPANSAVTSTDPLVKAFTTAIYGGDPRPQSVQFSNYWGNFGKAWDDVIPNDNSAGIDATSAVATACQAMDAANSFAP